MNRQTFEAIVVICLWFLAYATMGLEWGVRYCPRCATVEEYSAVRVGWWPDSGFVIPGALRTRSIPNGVCLFLGQCREHFWVHRSDLVTGVLGEERLEYYGRPLSPPMARLGPAKEVEAFLEFEQRSDPFLAERIRAYLRNPEGPDAAALYERMRQSFARWEGRSMY